MYKICRSTRVGPTEQKTFKQDTEGGEGACQLVVWDAGFQAVRRSNTNNLRNGNSWSR